MLRLRAAALRNFLSVIGDVKEDVGIRGLKWRLAALNVPDNILGDVCSKDEGPSPRNYDVVLGILKRSSGN